MSGWAWFSIIWFGTWAMIFAMSLVSTAVRARWGLSKQVELQIQRAVSKGIDAWMGGEDEEADDPLPRDDTLPLRFDDVDDLSGQL